MSDSPPPYSTHEPPLALWRRISNWAKSPSGVPVEELRPDSGYTRLILAAVYDIRLCEVMFDGWMNQLNRVTINSNRPSEQERLLEFYLGLLREGAGECSKSTNMILRYHVQFANLMAQRMDYASKSRLRALNTLNRDELETTTLADDINNASQELLLYVTRMKDNLGSFVSGLEKIEIRVGKEERVTWIWGWLKYFFVLIAWIFVVITRTAPADSHLTREAAEFCGMARTLEGKEFLKEIVPKEAQIAQKRLEIFDGALVVMGLEDRMKTRRGAAQYGRDPASIAKEWLDVAKLYQMVLPDDKDLGRLPPEGPEQTCS